MWIFIVLHYCVVIVVMHTVDIALLLILSGVKGEGCGYGYASVGSGEQGVVS